MIFNSKYKNKHCFKIGKSEIEVCKTFCYLGITISSSGNFNLATKRLKDKASKAYVAWRKSLSATNGTSVKTMLKLFDMLCKPILLYCSEVWGAFDSKWNKNSLKYFMNYDQFCYEKLHTKFCKQSLGVGNNSSNIASKSELGRFPLTSTVVINIVKYYLHIINQDENSLCRLALLSQISLHNNFSTTKTNFWLTLNIILKDLNLKFPIRDNNQNGKKSEYFETLGKKLK